MDINQLQRIFCEVDDFCKELNQYMAGKLLPSQTAPRGPACCLSDSEIMVTIHGPIAPTHLSRPQF